MIPMPSAAGAKPDAPAVQDALVRGLLAAARRSLPAGEVELVETHISYVLLAGPFAYKIKKAVDLGFLDFSTLEKRRFCCEEEVRLNRRLAPELYLGVVPITAPASGPCLGGAGEVVEYAVHMRRFPQDALLDRQLAAGVLSPGDIDVLADHVSLFHARSERGGGEYGTPAAVWAPMARNFARLAQGPLDAADRRVLAGIEAWSREEHSRLYAFLSARQREGFIRECHGDLHLGNIAMIDGNPRLFDCIEFNPQLRWIDVMSDLAFLVMDIEERGRPDYAWRLLNRYLESSGDYEGLLAFPFYQVYRALVRAKVACIRAAQKGSSFRPEDMEACRGYLAFARKTAALRQGELLVLHGLSGCGKTRLTQAIVERTGAIRLRSDVERKRLHGLPAQACSAFPVDRGIYDAAGTLATYRRLADLAGRLLAAGFPVVIDAANLKSWQRELFRHLARELRVRLRLIACHADDDTLRRRIIERSRAGDDASDADLAVLEQQRRSQDPLTPAELAASLRVDTGIEAPAEILDRLDNWRES